MDRNPVLVATKGPLEGARYPVGADGITLGRDSECTVILDDPNVSRFHARLVFHNAAIWIQDAGSRNGVFLNGNRVVRHKQFSPGDEILIGEHGFTLELELPVPDVSLTGSIQTVPNPAKRKKAMAAIFIGGLLLSAGVLVWLRSA